MNVVDSSGWLEYFADGPNAGFFAPAVEQTARSVVPIICLFEVFERVYQQRGEGSGGRLHERASVELSAARPGSYLSCLLSLRRNAMRAAAAGLMALLMVACGGGESGDMEQAGGMEEAGALTAADLAGTWDMRTWPAGSDSAVTYQVVATEDPAGWTSQMPGRDAVGLTVTIAGDSLVAVSEPFESVLRAGVIVWTTSVLRLENGRLVGTMVARYEGAGADSVLTGRIEGMRADQ